MEEVDRELPLEEMEGLKVLVGEEEVEKAPVVEDLVEAEAEV